jgi:hypothetical protein
MCVRLSLTSQEVVAGAGGSAVRQHSLHSVCDVSTNNNNAKRWRLDSPHVAVNGGCSRRNPYITVYCLAKTSSSQSDPQINFCPESSWMGWYCCLLATFHLCCLKKNSALLCCTFLLNCEPGSLAAFPQTLNGASRSQETFRPVCTRFSFLETRMNGD